MPPPLQCLAICYPNPVRLHPLRLGISRATSLLEGGKAIPVRRIEFERAGHAAAPTRKIEGAYRPSSVMASAMPPSPRGRLFFASLGGFQEVKDHTPSVTFGDSSPYTGEPTPRRENLLFPQIRKSTIPSRRISRRDGAFFLREIRIFFTSWTGKRRWRQRPSCLRPWPE